jgi:hypothetical protein
LYGIFHVWLGRRSLVYRIQQTFPSLAEIRHEIRWSMSNTACTGVSTLLLYWLVHEQRTHMYFAVGEHGWPYFVLSVVLGVAGYDAWFYWQHRLLHTPWLFSRVHAIHHRVANPPFATFFVDRDRHGKRISFLRPHSCASVALGLARLIIFASASSAISGTSSIRTASPAIVCWDGSTPRRTTTCITVTRLVITACASTIGIA